MKKPDSFKLYFAYLRNIDKLPNEQAGKFFKAIVFYATNNKLPDNIDPITEVLMGDLPTQMSIDLEKKASISVVRSEAGKIGGSVISKQTEANANQNAKNVSKSKQMLKNDKQKEAIAYPVKVKKEHDPNPYAEQCKKMRDLWEQKFGFPPEKSAIENTACKELAVKLFNVIKSKKPELTVYDIPGAFNYILNNWSKLDSFCQRGTSFKLINMNFTPIITKLSSPSLGSEQKLSKFSESHANLRDPRVQAEMKAQFMEEMKKDPFFQTDFDRNQDR